MTEHQRLKRILSVIEHWARGDMDDRAACQNVEAYFVDWPEQDSDDNEICLRCIDWQNLGLSNQCPSCDQVEHENYNKDD